MQPVKVLSDKLVVRRLIANELIMDSLPPNGPFAADAIAAECVMPNLAVRQLTAAVFPVLLQGTANRNKFSNRARSRS